MHALILSSGKEQEINSSCLDTLKKRRKTEVFADFVTSVFEEMDGKVDHERFKVFVTASATSAENPACSLSQDDKKAIGKAKSLSHCFVVLNLKYWNHQNMYLLERILERYAKNAEFLLSEYYKKMDEIDRIDEEEGIPRHLHLETNSKSLNASACSERFPSLIESILVRFRWLKVSPDVLKVFLSVVISASSLGNLCKARTLEEIFTALNCSVSWDHYNVLIQTVEEFGDEQSKQLVKDYNRDFQSLKSQNCSVITGSWHFPNAKHYISELKKKQIAKKVETLSGQFATVISKIFETIDPRSAINFISGVSASVQYPSLIKPFSNITKDASLSDVFLHLHHFGWNFRQCVLLQSLIAKCGTPELRSSLESYLERKSAFESATTLAELLWVLPQGSPPSRPEFVHMTLTFDTDLQDYTVQQLSEFQTLFTDTFQLHPYAVIWYTAKTIQSSLKLKFLIPSGVDCILVMESEEKTNFFYKHKISQVRLYDKGCYDFCYNFDQEHCKPVTMKSEAERIKKLAEKLQRFQTETASL